MLHNIKSTSLRFDEWTSERTKDSKVGDELTKPTLASIVIHPGLFAPIIIPKPSSFQVTINGNTGDR